MAHTKKEWCDQYQSLPRIALQAQSMEPQGSQPVRSLQALLAPAGFLGEQATKQTHYDACCTSSWLDHLAKIVWGVCIGLVHSAGNNHPCSVSVCLQPLAERVGSMNGGFGGLDDWQVMLC